MGLLGRRLIHHTRQKVFEVDNCSVEFYSLEHWVTVSADIVNGALQQYYCSIAMPARRDNGTVSFIAVRVLSASVSPEDRVDWLADAVKAGVAVVICNAKLVAVGLDLLDFPTLVFYQFTYEIATMRQAARRAWRIGQHRKCKVLYYVYEQSYEVVQLRRMLHNAPMPCCSRGGLTARKPRSLRPTTTSRRPRLPLQPAWTESRICRPNGEPSLTRTFRSACCYRKTSLRSRSGRRCVACPRKRGG